ncbi:unnamed protein product [Prorocentrum cordatum]|uniref:Fascin n=1 Tax=Prorocentrum cordatum TaxID=2364126 RepID=A0ABN9T1W9_9DINO|nr:unnamed protein product [Polarella glacialis]
MLRLLSPGCRLAAGAGSTGAGPRHRPAALPQRHGAAEAAEAGRCPRQPAVSLLQHDARWGRVGQGAPELRQGADADTRSEQAPQEENSEVHSDARPGGHLCERSVLHTLLLQAWGGPGAPRGASALLDRGTCGGARAGLLQLRAPGVGAPLAAGFLGILACGLAAACHCLSRGWPSEASAPQGCDAAGGAGRTAPAGAVPPVRWPSPERGAAPQVRPPSPAGPQGPPVHPAPALLGRTRSGRRPAAQVDKLKEVVPVAAEDGQAGRPCGAAAPEGHGGEDFCPGLVVPEGLECELEVPVAGKRGGTTRPTFTSPEGQGVLEVRPAQPAGAGGRGAGGFVLLEGDREVARCVAGDGEFRLLTAAGDSYAFLAQARRQTAACDRRFLLTTKTGARWEFAGSFGDHAVDVTDIRGNQRRGPRGPQRGGQHRALQGQPRRRPPAVPGPSWPPERRGPRAVWPPLR